LIQRDVREFKDLIRELRQISVEYHVVKNAWSI
jgi:hypothetical protein